MPDSRRLPLLATVFTLLLCCWSTAAPAADAPAAKEYDIILSDVPKAAPVGQALRLTLTIRPKAPWVLKTTTPFEATLSPSAGLTTEKAKLTAKDFADPQAANKSLNVTVTGKDKGSQHLGITLSFFLCSAELCERHKDSAEVKLEVE